MDHDFIVAVTDAVSISNFADRGRDIEVLHREGAAPHLGRTSINGFSEGELVSVGAHPLPLQPSDGSAQDNSACTRREISAIGIERGNTATTTSSSATSMCPCSTP